MTSKDAMEGGPDPLAVDAGLFEPDEGQVRDHTPSSMRTIAKELRDSLDALVGPGSTSGGKGTGSVNGLLDRCRLSPADIGQWEDAAAFAQTVGESSAGRKFVEVYREFVEAYQAVADAIEASAANHAEADRATEGGR